MKKIIFTVSLALMTVSMFSQYNSIYNRTIDINQKALAFGLSEAEFESIKHEAYANPNFLQGNIYQGDQLIKSDVLMRYNSYADEIEIQKNSYDKSYSALTKSPDIFVKIIKDLYVFVPYEGSNEKGGYFNVLSDGKVYDLYKKTKSVYREPKKAETSYGRDIPPSFVKSTIYYLVQNGTFYEMPNNKSKVIKMMDKKKTEIKTYINQHKINLEKESDMIKLVSYFDSLL